jgi:hypothetical protein
VRLLVTHLILFLCIICKYIVCIRFEFGEKTGNLVKILLVFKQWPQLHLTPRLCQGPSLVSRGVFQDRISFYFICEAIGTAATPDLLSQPRVKLKMVVEK